jgi:hypothetical protein
MQHWQVSGAVQKLCTDENYFEIHSVPERYNSEPSYIVFHHEYDNFMDKVGDVVGIYHTDDVMKARAWSRLRCQYLRTDKEMKSIASLRQGALEKLHRLEKEQDRYRIYGD